MERSEERSEDEGSWYSIERSDFDRLDRNKPVCIFTIVFPSINIYLLALLIPLFKVLENLIKVYNFKIDDIEVKFLLIDIGESESVLKTVKEHYKHLIGDIDTDMLNNILITEFESKVKLIFLHSNDNNIRKLTKNLKFERLKYYKDERLKEFIQGAISDISHKWEEIIRETDRENAEQIFAIRKHIFLKTEPLLINIVKAIQEVEGNKIIVTVDDISRIIKFIMELRRQRSGGREQEIIIVPYSDPIKVFNVEIGKPVPSFYTIISKYVNKKLKADFTLEKVKNDFNILNNKLFPRLEKNVIYEGFIRLQEEIIQELRLII